MKKFFSTILLSISLCFSKIAFGVDASTLNDLSPTNTIYTSQQVDQIADDISHEMSLDYATQIWVNNHKWDWTTQVTNKPSIPTVGTLNTTATTAQSTSTSESLSGNITLHKIAKTGAYGDLSGKPTIPTVGTLNTTLTTAQTTSANESLSGTIKLHKVSKTGKLEDMIGDSLMLGFEDKYVKIDNVGNIKYFDVFQGNDEYTLNLPRKNGTIALEDDVAAIVPVFNYSESYSKGDLVRYNSKLYKAKQNIAAKTAWNASNWEEVTIANELRSLVSISMVNALVDKRIAYAVENGITVNGTNYVLITENTLTNVLQNYHGQGF